MSKTIALYHIVFCTKSREKTIPLAYKNDLYRFVWNEIRRLNCSLVRIGGVQNHVHLLVDLHPSVALATLVRAIKANSSGWMKSDDRFSGFRGWASEYFASSISPDDKEDVVQYIRNQEEHHLRCKEDDEFKRLYRYAGFDYKDCDLT